MRLIRPVHSYGHADVAQLVEHFTRNEGVRGSNPRVGSGVHVDSGAFAADLGPCEVVRCSVPLAASRFVCVLGVGLRHAASRVNGDARLGSHLRR